MGIRKKLNHNEACREKIQTSQIINRLENHVFTYEDDENYKKKYLTDSQVRAAVGLLKKTLPDLQSIEISGDEDNPLIHKHNLASDILKSIPTDKLEEILASKPREPDDNAGGHTGGTEQAQI